MRGGGVGGVGGGVEGKSRETEAPSGSQSHVWAVVFLEANV